MLLLLAAVAPPAAPPPIKLTVPNKTAVLLTNQTMGDVGFPGRADASLYAIKRSTGYKFFVNSGPPGFPGPLVSGLHDLSSPVQFRAHIATTARAGQCNRCSQMVDPGNCGRRRARRRLLSKGIPALRALVSSVFEGSSPLYLHRMPLGSAAHAQMHRLSAGISARAPSGQTYKTATAAYACSVLLALCLAPRRNPSPIALLDISSKAKRKVACAVRCLAPP